LSRASCPAEKPGSLRFYSSQTFATGSGFPASIDFLCLAIRQPIHVMDKLRDFAVAILNEDQFGAVDLEKKVGF
jgi:hypothetical protein